MIPGVRNALVAVRQCVRIAYSGGRVIALLKAIAKERVNVRTKTAAGAGQALGDVPGKLRQTVGLHRNAAYTRVDGYGEAQWTPVCLPPNAFCAGLDPPARARRCTHEQPMPTRLGLAIVRKCQPTTREIGYHHVSSAGRDQ